MISVSLLKKRAERSPASLLVWLLGARGGGRPHGHEGGTRGARGAWTRQGCSGPWCQPPSQPHAGHRAAPHQTPRPSTSHPIPRAGHQLLPCLTGVLGTQNPEGQSSGCTDHIHKPCPVLCLQSVSEFFFRAFRAGGHCRAMATWRKRRRFSNLLAAASPCFRKTEAKSELLFYQLLFYSFINTVVFTSIIDVNIIPKLSNT